MAEGIVKESEIKVSVGLDENNVPEEIRWFASDNNEEKECKAVMLSVWDGDNRDTLRIDLWNKEMQVDEMKLFIHQTMHTMADTFERATGEQPMAMAMRDFCDYFAEKMGLLNQE
jgi:gliding motility-associated protein GldC